MRRPRTAVVLAPARESHWTWSDPCGLTSAPRLRGGQVRGPHRRRAHVPPCRRARWFEVNRHSPVFGTVVIGFGPIHRYCAAMCSSGSCRAFGVLGRRRHEEEIGTLDPTRLVAHGPVRRPSHRRTWRCDRVERFPCRGTLRRVLRAHRLRPLLRSINRLRHRCGKEPRKQDGGHSRTLVVGIHTKHEVASARCRCVRTFSDV
jgi:hypothetical protein